jgi:hypothetical protein
MKMAKTTMIILFMCFALLAACSEQTEPTGTAVAPETEEPADVIKEKAEDAMRKPESQLQEISGTVMRTEDGFALFADTDQYKIIGQDLTDMVGENVKVIGTIEEQEGTPVIMITSVSLIE